ncbi:DUF4352 domain-containing protein [Paenibacillus bovis]|uniref:DUF4352 domain-containing protein n=1 Tax=Paenibacillus bovis TaxID=1616788 RepID=A0A172ZJV7_9BACL|nr:DUF4352 domain-containing protein [Paenibacillus bovis]ANF97878.1 hypothetical protein AR543_18890 [Paenibacillus bovis]
MKKAISTLIACAIFGTLAAGSMNSDEPSSTSSSTSSSNTASAKKEGSTAPKQEKKEFYIGDGVSVGGFAVMVHTPEVKSSVGNQYLRQEANGEYWAVPISVINNDKEARMVTMAMFKLVSKDGRSYDSDATAVMYMDSQNKLLLDNINPGVQVDGYIVFDMPTGQKMSNYSMEVSDPFSFTRNNQVLIKLAKK